MSARIPYFKASGARTPCCGSKSVASSSKRRVCDAAVEVLRETNNPAVMWGDGYLLHLISERAGRESDGYKTEQRVLSALNRTPGELKKWKTACGWRGRWVSIFYLPEHFPHDKETGGDA